VLWTLVACLVLSCTVAACGGARHKSATTEANPPESVGSASVGFGSIDAGSPGLRFVRVNVPSADVEFSPSKDTSQAAPNATALSKQIRKAAPGTVIHLSSGTYPKLYDTKRRNGWITVSGAGDATKPVISMAKLWGASDVRFVDIDFTRLRINSSPLTKSQYAENIQVLNSEVDCGATKTKKHGSSGITIRGGSRNILFDGDYVHDCVIGFGSDAQDPMSHNVSIIHSLFENLYGDAIDLGAMDHLTIAYDVIRYIARTKGHDYHDDGIQFFGNTSNVVIAYDVLANSLDQLLFIQDAVKSRETKSSVNRNILVLGDLIYGAGAVPVQDQGGVDVQFVGDTIWAGRVGSLLVRRSGYTGIVPNHTLVADSIIEQFNLDHVHGGITEGYDIFARTGHRRGPHIRVKAKVGLSNPRAGHFALAPGSPGLGAAAPPRTLLSMAKQAGAGPAALNLIKRYPGGDLGAPADVVSQGYGAPFTLTGEKLRQRQ
jgi:hypothetical protein